MSPHLPYASDDDDEFLHPSLGWLLIDRTVVYDSWIHWRQVLPPDRPGREQLDATAATLIEALAARLHAIHQRMVSYAELDDTPFRFHRWWEPRSEIEDFRNGSGCIFSIKQNRPQAFMDAFLEARPGQLALMSFSGELFKARLTHTDPSCLAPVARPSEHSAKRPSRRRRQILPAQTPDSSQPDPLPGPTT